MRPSLFTQMLRIRISVFAILTAWTAFAVADDLATRIDAWLQPYVEIDHLSGCVLVARGEDVVYDRCFGLANRELGVRNTPETRFAVASVTKPLQLVLLARLVEEGALALTDSLTRWLPDFPRAHEITVLNLANHTAAVPHRVTEDHEESVMRSAADMVELVKAKGLLGEPGGERVYSSAGFSVLARVLELAGGDTWSALMQRYVFEPAGMEHTVHPEDRNLIPRRASSYSWSPRGLRNAAPKDLSFLVGAGSLYSTPRDLWRAVRATVNGGYGPNAQAYVVRQRESFGWNGVTNGYRTFVDHDTTTDVTVVVCANVVTGALDRIRDALPKLAAGEDPGPADVPDYDPVTVTPAALAAYEGRYQLRPGSILNVRARDSALYANEWLLLPLGDDRFFSVQDYGALRFVPGDAGEMLHIEWGESDPPFTLPRVGALE